jgi:lipoate-protein ligase A
MSSIRVLPFRNEEAEILMEQDARLLEKGKSIDFPFTFSAYTWKHPCLTYGYLQKPEQLLNLELLRRRNVPVVRRPTGGKVALHGHDLAYSLTCRVDKGGVRDLVLEWIGVLASALCELGYPVVAGADKSHDLWSQPLCGAERGPADILLNGRKLAGHAFRKQGTVLQLQGTLSLCEPGEEIWSLLEAFPPGAMNRDELTWLPDKFGDAGLIAGHFASYLGEWRKKD